MVTKLRLTRCDMQARNGTFCGARVARLTKNVYRCPECAQLWWIERHRRGPASKKPITLGSPSEAERAAYLLAARLEELSAYLDREEAAASRLSRENRQLQEEVQRLQGAPR